MDLLGLVGTLEAPDHVAMVERFGSAVAGCRVVAIEEAAHMLNMERPAQVNAAVKAFLDTQ